jgi:phytoene dehydrogenase-like protein
LKSGSRQAGRFPPGEKVTCELTIDQLLFNRPFPGFAQYRGPARGLYLCGSATHPGGGVMAAPGANAAREVLLDLRRPGTVPEGWGDD